MKRWVSFFHEFPWATQLHLRDLQESSSHRRRKSRTRCNYLGSRSEGRKLHGLPLTYDVQGKVDSVRCRFGGFLKFWHPTTMGFPTKNDHFGVFWGYHHFRKHSFGCTACFLGWWMFFFWRIDWRCFWKLVVFWGWMWDVHTGSCVADLAVFYPKLVQSSPSLDKGRPTWCKVIFD